MTSGATEPTPTPDDTHVNARRVFFDWSFLLPLVACAIAWGTLSATQERNTKEIERLRTANDARSLSDVRIAESMATRADVQKVSDQVQALASELRSNRSR